MDDVSAVLRASMKKEDVRWFRQMMSIVDNWLQGRVEAGFCEGGEMWATSDQEFEQETSSRNRW
jgi:hypothetical protein